MARPHEVCVENNYISIAVLDVLSFFILNKLLDTEK